jgi:hypothetical protein
MNGSIYVPMPLFEVGSPDVTVRAEENRDGVLGVHPTHPSFRVLRRQTKRVRHGLQYVCGAGKSGTIA